MYNYNTDVLQFIALGAAALVPLTVGAFISGVHLQHHGHGQRPHSHSVKDMLASSRFTMLGLAPLELLIWLGLLALVSAVPEGATGSISPLALVTMAALIIICLAGVVLGMLCLHDLGRPGGKFGTYACLSCTYIMVFAVTVFWLVLSIG